MAVQLATQSAPGSEFECSWEPSGPILETLGLLFGRIYPLSQKKKNLNDHVSGRSARIFGKRLALAIFPVVAILSSRHLGTHSLQLLIPVAPCPSLPLSPWQRAYHVDIKFSIIDI